MMKQLLFALFLSLTPLLSHAEKHEIITAPAEEETLLPDKIYFFAHSMCHDCRDAYIYIDSTHADLNIPITDVKFSRNLELYKQCVKKFEIPNKELTLPLFCMGNEYLMGWKENAPALFEQKLKAFQEKK